MLFNCYFKCGGVWIEFLFSKFIPNFRQGEIWQFFYMVSSSKGNIKVISCIGVGSIKGGDVPVHVGWSVEIFFDRTEQGN